MLEILARTLRQEKERKGIQIGIEEVKLSVFADDLMLYIGNPKKSTTELLELMKKVCKFSGYKSVYRNQLLFYMLINYQSEKLRKQSYLL